MICKKTTRLLICLTIVFALFTLSYNLVVIWYQSEVIKVLATSDDGSGDSRGNSDDTDPDNTDPCADGCTDPDDLYPAPPKGLVGPCADGCPELESPEDLGTEHGSDSEADKFHLNSEDIALELSSLTPLQIGEYPITDLSDNDLTLALSFLAPADLGKVLTNIPVQDLVVVKERLGESKFNEFLSKVSVSDREVLKNILAI